MRTLALALVACGGGHPVTAPPPPPPAGGGSATTESTTSTTSQPAADLTPPTTGLAVGIAAFVVIDDAGSRIFARKGSGIDILALDSGTKTGRIDLSGDGELWPAGKNLVSMRFNGLAIDAVLVDPAAAKILASCSTAVKAPPNAVILRVDEFTTHAGTTYLKWETAPPPRRMGGARLSDEQMEQMNREFQAAHACGLYAIHVTGSRCTLDVASYQDAGLEACGTRSMPWNRYLPTPIGSLTLRVDRASGYRAGLMTETETLVVSDSQGERWKLPLETSAIEPPAP